jgi:hypothetical protein
MNPDPVAELIRLTQADIVAFMARMREVPPAFCLGNRVKLHGEEFEISSYHPEGMPGYWLRGVQGELFLPVDLQGVLWLWRMESRFDAR